MVRSNTRMMAFAVCLVAVACSHHAAPEDPPMDSKAIEGLWYGSWGGGERDGTVFQPVIAEMLINGDHVEVYGFRNVGTLAGTVRFDASAKQMHITPAPESGRKPTPKAIDYAFEIKGDQLTLIDSDKIPILLERRRVGQNPLANTELELVSATGINDAGDLLVTEFTVLRAGRAGTTYFEPLNRSLKTNQATVLVVQETGLKKITLDEARGLIRESTPVAVAYRHDDRPPPHQFHELWKDTGPPAPDSDAVGQTFSRTLRPGTLVFILSARENVPQP
jgi:hypothetical protein